MIGDRPVHEAGAIGVLFGGLGMFFLYYSFSNPILAAYALMFLGTASAITWSAAK